MARTAEEQRNLDLVLEMDAVQDMRDSLGYFQISQPS